MGIALLNPVLSEISGRIGSVVFYRRYDKQCVRTYVVPRNPDTDAQKSIRKTFANAVKSWQSLACDEKYKFIKKARNMQMSGYNLYLSDYMKDIFAAGSKPAQRPSITDKPDTSGIQRHIHSVSKPFLNIIAPILVINGIINSPG